jgi:ribose-phosphate pyrophosphokinase
LEIIITQSKINNFNNFSVYIGDNVKGKDVLIIDDMIHSGTKLTETIKEVKQMGANEIFAYITHNLLTQQSFQNIDNLPLSELITTNTISNVN